MLISSRHLCMRCMACSCFCFSSIAKPELCLMPCPPPRPKPCLAPCPPQKGPTSPRPTVKASPVKPAPTPPTMCPVPCPTKPPTKPLPSPKLCLAPCPASNRTEKQPKPCVSTGPANASSPGGCQKNPPAPALVPCELPCLENVTKNATQCKKVPLDLVILVDGCDMVNESHFRNALEIAKNVYHAFPVSKQGTHVALAVYGSSTEVIMGLKKYFDITNMDETIQYVKKPGGSCLAGRALYTVKTDIFDNSARSRDVPSALLHIMCGKSVDDVTVPSNTLKNDGVMILASGACAQTSKLDLCTIGSPPMCTNAMTIRTFRPPEVPAKELACKIKDGVY